jgi:hypothetical protein
LNREEPLFSGCDESLFAVPAEDIEVGRWATYPEVGAQHAKTPPREGLANVGRKGHTRVADAAHLGAVL